MSSLIRSISRCFSSQSVFLFLLGGIDLGGVMTSRIPRHCSPVEFPSIVLAEDWAVDHRALRLNQIRLRKDR
jgi:hypothetical protein